MSISGITVLSGTGIEYHNGKDQSSREATPSALSRSAAMACMRYANQSRKVLVFPRFPMFATADKAARWYTATSVPAQQEAAVGSREVRPVICDGNGNRWSPASRERGRKTKWERERE